MKTANKSLSEIVLKALDGLPVESSFSNRAIAKEVARVLGSHYVKTRAGWTKVVDAAVRREKRPLSWKFHL